MAHNLRAQITMAGKTGRLEQETAGHIVSTVRKEGVMDVSTQLPLPLGLGPQHTVLGYPCLRQASPPQLT